MKATIPAISPIHVSPAATAIPPLRDGDRLTRAEFERRYEAMPHVKKAELLEGVVHMPSPVRFHQHGKPHLHLATWLGNYEADTPGVEAADNATARLDMDNEPQPDAMMIVSPEVGGRTTIVDGYVEGGIVECPLHFGKFDIRNGRALSAPCTIDVRIYPVSVAGDSIAVCVASDDAAGA